MRKSHVTLLRKLLWAFTILFAAAVAAPNVHADSYYNINWATPVPANVPTLTGLVEFSPACPSLYIPTFYFEGYAFNLAGAPICLGSGLSPSDTFTMNCENAGIAPDVLNCGVVDDTGSYFLFNYDEPTIQVPSFEDDFTLTPVPEPGAGVLTVCGIGLLGVMSVMRRRKTQGLRQAR